MMNKFVILVVFLGVCYYIYYKFNKLNTIIENVQNQKCDPNKSKDYSNRTSESQCQKARNKENDKNLANFENELETVKKRFENTNKKTMEIYANHMENITNRNKLENSVKNKGEKGGDENKESEKIEKRGEQEKKTAGNWEKDNMKETQFEV